MRIVATQSDGRGDIYYVNDHGGDYLVVHRFKDNAVICLICKVDDCGHEAFVRRERRTALR